MRWICGLAAAFALGSAAQAQITRTPDAGPPPAATDNAEGKAIFEADQADRQLDKIDWAVVRPRDLSRYARMKAILVESGLSTGKDYERASFIFQHGSEPDDYLLAHVLAVTAVARGDAQGSWIAAATLDRYLQRIGRNQVFGTQYLSQSDAPASSVTQEPYDRTLISDALRRANRVQTQAEQEKARLEMAKER